MVITYVKLNTLFFIGVLIFIGGAVTGQTVSSGSGEASTISIWDTGEVPSVFGGSATGDITVQTGDTLWFEGNANIETSYSLSVASGAALVVYGDITIAGNLTVNGLLVCSGSLKAAKKSNPGVNGAGGEMFLGFVDSKLNIQSGLKYTITEKIWRGSTDQTWSVRSNWIPEGAPKNVGVVISPVAGNQPVLDGKSTLNSFHILNGESTLTIAAGGSLTLIDSIANNGVLNVQSDATGTGSLISSVAVGNGIFNVQRYMPSDNWHILSSPVGGQQMLQFAGINDFELFTDGSYDLAPYNENLGDWGPFDIGLTNIEEFTPATGYITRLPLDSIGKVITYSGNSVFTSTVTKDIDSTRNGWNSVGNPYLSAIQGGKAPMNSFLKENAEQLSPQYGGLYFWDNTLNDYVIMGSADKMEITVGQGFIVKSKRGGGTLTFNTDMQTHANDAQLKAAILPIPEIELFVQAGYKRNNTRINFVQNNTYGLDPTYDVGKLKGNAEIALYTKLIDGNSNVDFGVQSLPDVSFDSLTIPVGLDLPGGGEAIFTLQTSAGFPGDASVYLEDTELEKLTRLNLEGANYLATLPEVKGTGRFNLVVKNYSSSNTSTNVEKLNPTELKYKIYSRDRLIIIVGEADQNTELSLYNIEGKLFHKTMAKDLNENRIDASAFPNGIYLLKISNKGDHQTHKVVLTN